MTPLWARRFCTVTAWVYVSNVTRLVAVSAIYFSERRHDSTPVSANAIVEVAADAQRDLSRVPMRLTRLADDQEIAIGNELAEQYSINSDKMSPEELALDGYIRRWEAR